jgi:hypothetical protein
MRDQLMTAATSPGDDGLVRITLDQVMTAATQLILSLTARKEVAKMLLSDASWLQVQRLT